MHPTHHHRIGPVDILPGYRTDILIDKPDFPRLREIGSDQKDSLRRHERLYPLHQPVGMMKGTERLAVLREDAQHPAAVRWNIGRARRLAGHAVILAQDRALKTHRKKSILPRRPMNTVCCGAIDRVSDQAYHPLLFSCNCFPMIIVLQFGASWMDASN
jgi:hypothetical protein